MYNDSQTPAHRVPTLVQYCQRGVFSVQRGHFGRYSHALFFPQLLLPMLIVRVAATRLQKEILC